MHAGSSVSVSSRRTAGLAVGPEKQRGPDAADRTRAVQHAGVIQQAALVDGLHQRAQLQRHPPLLLPPEAGSGSRPP